MTEGSSKDELFDRILHCIFSYLQAEVLICSVKEPTKDHWVLHYIGICDWNAELHILFKEMEKCQS